MIFPHIQFPSSLTFQPTLPKFLWNNAWKMKHIMLLLLPCYIRNFIYKIEKNMEFQSKRERNPKLHNLKSITHRPSIVFPSIKDFKYYLCWNLDFSLLHPHCNNTLLLETLGLFCGWPPKSQLFEFFSHLKQVT